MDALAAAHDAAVQMIDTSVVRVADANAQDLRSDRGERVKFADAACKRCHVIELGDLRPSRPLRVTFGLTYCHAPIDKELAWRK